MVYSTHGIGYRSMRHAPYKILIGNIKGNFTLWAISILKWILRHEARHGALGLKKVTELNWLSVAETVIKFRVS